MPRLIFTKCVYSLPSPPQTDPVYGKPIVLVDEEPVQFADPSTQEPYAPDWPEGVDPHQGPENQG